MRSGVRALSGDHEVPLELFEPREAKEKRAATDAPATGPQVNEQLRFSPIIYKEDSRRISSGSICIRPDPGTPSLPGAHHRDSRRR